MTWCTVPYCRYWYLYLMKLHLFSSWLQDPYCAWDLRGEICRGAQSWAKGSLFFTNYWYRLCFLWLSIVLKKKIFSRTFFNFFLLLRPVFLPYLLKKKTATFYFSWHTKPLGFRVNFKFYIGAGWGPFFIHKIAGAFYQESFRKSLKSEF